MARFVKDGSAQLYWDNSLKFETLTSGVKWHGDLFCDDNQFLKLGSSADLQIYHDSTSNNSFITEGGSGSLVIKATNTYINAANDQAMIAAVAGGAVTLYHANSPKIATTGSGISVTGNIAVSGTVDGVDIAALNTTVSGLSAETASSINALFGDNDNLILGAADGDGDDALKLYYDGSAGIITADGGVKLQFDGSPKLETKTWGVQFNGDLENNSNSSRIKLGASDQLQIFHDGTNGVIDETGTGGLLVYANDIIFHEKSNASHRIADFSQDESTGCRLYYNNTIRFQTNNSGASITGNLAVTGNVDGRDVSSDGSKLDGIANNANNYSLPTATAGTLGGIKVGANLSISNGVLSASASGGGSSGFEFDDNVRIKFGESDDLQLFHDTNNSVIDATGDGGLLLYAADIIFQEKTDGSHRMADFAQDGGTGCRLYYDNGVKLQTTSSGITCGNIIVSTSQNQKMILSGAANPYIHFYEGSTAKAYIQWNANGYLELHNQETSEALKISSGANGLIFRHGGNDKTVYHTGNLSEGDGGLTQKNFTTTLKNKLDGIASSATNNGSGNVSDRLARSGGTMTGDLTMDNNSLLRIGDGAGQERILIKKADNNTSDHIIFYNGTTRIGEIGCHDNSWLRINQQTNKNIYTPRMIRADGGFQVNGTTVINTSAQVPAGRVSGTVSNATRAENLAGYSQNESASNNTIVRRNSSGYIFGNYFNGSGTFSTSGNSSGMARFTGTNGSDTYGRSYTAAAARALLNVENGATADQTASDINNLYPDNGNLILGTGTGSDTLKMYYNGSVGILTSNNGVILQFNGSTKIYTKSNGGRVNGAWFINNDTRYLSDIGGQYGSIQINGGGAGGYEGFSIDGRAVFMHNGGSDTGIYNDVNNEWMLYCGHNSTSILYFNGAQRIRTESYGARIAGTIRPNSTNGGDCGASDARWGTVYASNGSINTSDRNEKNSILEADLGLDFINKLKPVSYKWNDTRLGKKTHYGLIAQEVEEAIEKVGKDVDEIAMVQNPEFGPKGLYYNEIIGPLVKSVQELSAKVAALEAA